MWGYRRVWRRFTLEFDWSVNGVLQKAREKMVFLYIRHLLHGQWGVIKSSRVGEGLTSVVH
jgi:hypothetical protein